MQKTLLTLLLALIALPVLAKDLDSEPAPSSSSVKSMANQEIEVKADEKTKKNNASDAGMSGGIIVLQDPYKELNTKSYKWIAELRAQAFRPKGSVNNAGTNVDLGGINDTVLPTAAFGIELKPLSAAQNGFNLWTDITADISYTNQNYDSSSITGTTINNKISTTAYGATLKVLANQSDDTRWRGFLNADYSQFNVARVSDSSTQRWSENKTTLALGAGAEYDFTNYNKKISQILFADFSARRNLSQSDLDLSGGYLELGFKVLW